LSFRPNRRAEANVGDQLWVSDSFVAFPQDKIKLVIWVNEMLLNTHNNKFSAFNIEFLPRASEFLATEVINNTDVRIIYITFIYAY
jgi:hypothetical protein